MPSKDRVWESVERIEGNFLGFVYQVVRLNNGLWRGTAHFPGQLGKDIISKQIVGFSPGEALIALADSILKVSPIKE